MVLFICTPIHFVSVFFVLQHFCVQFQPFIHFPYGTAVDTCFARQNLYEVACALTSAVDTCNMLASYVEVGQKMLDVGKKQRSWIAPQIGFCL